MYTLDAILEKGFIEKEHHDAGLKLRKMHDVIFGSAVIKAYDISRIKGRSCRKIDEEYLRNIENEYMLLIDMLMKNRFWEIVSEVCIYQNENIPSNNIDRSHYLSSVKDGLDMIAEYFKNSKKSYDGFKKFNNGIEKLGLI